MKAAVDVDDLPRGEREPVREQAHAGPGHGFGVAHVPAQRGALGPHPLEVLEAVGDLADGRWRHATITIARDPAGLRVTVTLNPAGEQVVTVGQVTIPGAAPYEGRLHFGAEGPPWDPPAEHFEKDVTAPTMQRIARRMVELMPVLRPLAVERAWSGIIAMTPDLMPIVDALPSPRGLILATGFGGNGFGTSPAFGEAVAQLVADGRSELDTSPFVLARFASASSPV